MIDGVAVAPGAPHRRVAHGSKPVVATIQAPGYRNVRLDVVPDRDRSLIVSLSPVPIAPAASAAKPKSTPRAPAAGPSGVIRRYPF
jgi:hypothetical protein